ncbi:MAG TPA: phosphatase PAP2 family protein [Candidatus Kapabacteria bacterium]|nr:phosphatase PAP2 family protein [Candidatus Kapabacteria bacterium]
METLFGIDLYLFKLFNQAFVNPIFDAIMPIITKEKNLLPVYAIALFILIWKGGRRGQIVALLLIITVVISDQLSSTVIKNFVGRLRPCHELIDVRLLVNCGSGKSFPSSHAVNIFAAAILLSGFFRRYWYIFISIAIIIAYTRVYCGVHYPSDVIAGAIIGSVIGYLCYRLFLVIKNKYNIVF